MHNELIIKAFQKAAEKTGSSVTSRLAAHLSDYILEETGESFGERSLRDYYNTALKEEGDRVELRPFVVQALCTYLGFETFDKFNQRDTKKSKSEGIKKTLFNWPKGLWIALAIGVLGIGIFVTLRMNAQRMMVWKGDHYEEVQLDVKNQSLSDLKLYNEERILHFRKVQPDCESSFFDENGLAQLWYGKNVKGELEYFTALGLHPETGKTLKEITPYMIKKYICDTYK